MSIATFSVSGRLAKDCEMGYLQSGMAKLTFTVASDYSRKEKDGWTKEASFFDMILFGKRAESVKKYLLKGTQVFVTGNLRQEKWTSKDGVKHYRVAFYVEELDFVGGKRAEGFTEAPESYTVDFPKQEFPEDIPF